MTIYRFAPRSRPDLEFIWNTDSMDLERVGTFRKRLDPNTQKGRLLKNFLDTGGVDTDGYQLGWTGVRTNKDDLAVNVIWKYLWDDVFAIDKAESELFVKNRRGKGYFWLALKLSPDQKPIEASPPMGPNRALEENYWTLFGPGSFDHSEISAHGALEKPSLRLQLSKSFRLGRPLVTNELFGGFVEGKGYGEDRFWCSEGLKFRDGLQLRAPKFWGKKPWSLAQHPVVGVNWYEARAFCRRLAEQLAGCSWWQPSWTLDLPTEVQWEFAARSRFGRMYPWGEEDPIKQRANFGFLVGATTPVDQCRLGATPEGLLDMAGNVWEWCLDRWSKNAYEFWREHPQDPLVFHEWAPARVIRGGSWGTAAPTLRTTWRDADGVFNRDKHVGFRLCINQDQ